MAYGLNKDEFWIKEGSLYVGSYSAISYNDPASNFSGDNIGYFKQGSTSFPISREYAEALAGTPAVLVRKDLTRKMMGIETDLFQVGNKDLLTLVMNTDINVSGTNENHFLGHDENTPSFYGFLLDATLVDGSAVKIGIWYGQVTTEDLTLALSGTEHATIHLKVEAFPHPDITNEKRDYGFIQYIRS